jgi:hypothetical protein
MKRYRVVIVEEVTYSVDLEAEDDDAAAEIALEMLVQNSDSNAYFVSVDERDVTNVIEDPPNWEADD